MKVTEMPQRRAWKPHKEADCRGTRTTAQGLDGEWASRLACGLVPDDSTLALYLTVEGLLLKPWAVHRVVTRLAVPLRIEWRPVVTMVTLELVLRELLLTPLTPIGLLNLSRSHGLLKFALGLVAQPEGCHLPRTGREGRIAEAHGYSLSDPSKAAWLSL